MLHNMPKIIFKFKFWYNNNNNKNRCQSAQCSRLSHISIRYNKIPTKYYFILHLYKRYNTLQHLDIKATFY